MAATENTTPNYFMVRRPGDKDIGKIMRNGATLYRNLSENEVVLVPDGVSHSAAWRYVMGR